MQSSQLFDHCEQIADSIDAMLEWNLLQRYTFRLLFYSAQ